MKHYWLCDPAGDYVGRCDSLDDAIRGGAEIIKSYRDECDPEWPMGVSDVCVVYGEADEEQDDAIWQYLPVVYQAVEVDKIWPESEEEALGWDVDYMCDYRLEPVDGALTGQEAGDDSQTKAE